MSYAATYGTRSYGGGANILTAPPSLNLVTMTAVASVVVVAKAKLYDLVAMAAAGAVACAGTVVGAAGGGGGGAPSLGMAPGVITIGRSS